MVALAVAVAIAIAVAISIVVANFITIVVAVAHRRRRQPSHCSCHLHWPSLSPLPLAISESCCLGTARIVFDQLKQRMLTLYYCVWTVGGKIDQSQMTDQVSSGDGQHQCWTVSGKQ